MRLTTRTILRQILGLAICGVAGYAVWWLWLNYRWVWTQVLLPNPLRDHPLAEDFGAPTLNMIRTVAIEQSFVVQLVAAMLLVTLLDWLWRMTFGRIDH
ncbi:MAG: hypothetical protein AAFR16_12960 [Pseudomonadota bacterium]